MCKRQTCTECISETQCCLHPCMVDVIHMYILSIANKESAREVMHRSLVSRALYRSTTSLVRVFASQRMKQVVVTQYRLKNRFLQRFPQ